MKKFFTVLVAALVTLIVVTITFVWGLDALDQRQAASVFAPGEADVNVIERGAYLARVGSCMACHTARGGPPYAGGRGIETPFGTVFSGNLTADKTTGIGQWNASDFWRALHHGRARDGRLLYPAFPYTSYTQVTRADSDALFAYLGSLPAVEQPNKAHTLRWPYGTRAALLGWRALYFKPVAFEVEASRSEQWNRGAYLVRGPGHCTACHTARNALGGSDMAHEFGGGLVPVQDWYAPSLTSSQEAGVATWSVSEIVQLLGTGQSARGTTSGPMSEVVLHSTQYWSSQDLEATAVFLKTLPEADKEKDAGGKSPVPSSPAQGTPMVAGRGAQLYEKHCAQCHGKSGEGVPNAYPALAGNRAITLSVTANLIQIVLKGGFLPATQGNPRPFGMPPFALVLSDRDLADVLTHIRTTWNNEASPVSELDVNRFREKNVQSGR